jgi:hypothetical protein
LLRAALYRAGTGRTSRWLEQENSLEETLLKKVKKRTDKLSKAIEKMRKSGLQVEEITEGGFGFIGGIPPRKTK